MGKEIKKMSVSDENQLLSEMEMTEVYGGCDCEGGTNKWLCKVKVYCPQPASCSCSCHQNSSSSNSGSTPSN